GLVVWGGGVELSRRWGAGGLGGLMTAGCPRRGGSIGVGVSRLPRWLGGEDGEGGLDGEGR
ncbi:MAG: hypothetical protein O2895_07000, partial [Chloroflexi bacterium]|nr:hypothetical protein [Chloroflexota bacterium]